MCGIVGGIGFPEWDEKKTLSCISHRGPDSQGSFSDEYVFLGHTRLSIQDLSPNGNQPMYSADGRYVIIFNGEIYNHSEVRSPISHKYDFRSSGDTETVLYAYIEYGAACLSMLNGIFALAVYDTKDKTMFIARDQLGVKPLYLYHGNNNLLFSSELKSFIPFSIDRSLDPVAFENYLTFLWSPGERTPLKNVKKLLPGHYILIDVKAPLQPKPVEYYRIPVNGKYDIKTELELIDQLEEKLLGAVRRQMLSDVPVGFFLSGGLDSSLIVALAKKMYPGTRFPCFTIDVGNWGSGEGFANDLHYAKRVADFLDVDLHIVKANVDIVKDFDQMIWHLDEPQADAAPLNVLNIATLARQKGIKVLIGGAGGDDLFSGYRRHQAITYEKYFTAMPLFLRKIIKLGIERLPSGNMPLRRIKKVLQDIDKTSIERQAGYFNWLPLQMVQHLFSSEWRETLKDYDPSCVFYELAQDISHEKNPLNRMLYWEMKTFLVDHNLNYTDKMTMAVGVEARVPFLDLELVEFAQRIPPHLKLKGKETKYILKKVAERHLPHDVIYRPKTGFGAPVREWITGDLQQMIQERLSSERIKQRGIFDAEKVWQLINDNRKGKIDASYSIWALLAIESWLEQFADPIV